MLSTKVLEERQSAINGKIQVVKSSGLGTCIQVEGLTQSGGVVESIWKSTLKKLRTKELKNCLILGLGGGSVAKLARKYWKDCWITGVEIDSVMVELGRKYLGLNETEIEIEIGDAYDWVIQNLKAKNQNYKSKFKNYDLILIDLYVGYEVPEKFQTDKFLRLIPRLLTGDGIAVFNRLYFGEKRSEALGFAKKLEKVFKKVDYFYPEANVMMICQA